MHSQRCSSTRVNSRQNHSTSPFTPPGVKCADKDELQFQFEDAILNSSLRHPVETSKAPQPFPLEANKRLRLPIKEKKQTIPKAQEQLWRATREKKQTTAPHSSKLEFEKVEVPSVNQTSSALTNGLKRRQQQQQQQKQGALLTPSEMEPKIIEAKSQIEREASNVKVIHQANTSLEKKGIWQSIKNWWNSPGIFSCFVSFLGGKKNSSKESRSFVCAPSSPTRSISPSPSKSSNLSPQSEPSRTIATPRRSVILLI